MIQSLILLAATHRLTPSVHSPAAPRAAAIAPPNIGWWKRAKFGMFIHWGIYSVPADSTLPNGGVGAAEWYLSNKRMKPEVYAKFASKFNPKHFNATQWVRYAKDAGMKYMVITSKHHDGFCMWPTQYTNFCLGKDSPFKQDPLGELDAACKRAGLKFGLYHSIMDWHNINYLPRRPWDDRPTAGHTLDKYLVYMQNELKELIRRYHPSIIWFDGGWEHNAQELHSAQVNEMIRRLDPGVLINNRNAGYDGDFGTPEQTIPGKPEPKGENWETCMTINNTWGYAKNDKDWKSWQTLVQNLCLIVGRGGNYLLNVGPKSDGTFPRAIVDRLEAIGKWIKVNGSAIYATQAGPYVNVPFDGANTLKGNSLYLEVFHFPHSGKLRLPGFQGSINRVSALATGRKLPWKEVDGTVTIDVSSLVQHADSAATVVRVQCKGSISVIPQLTAQPESGAWTLGASDADVHGSTARYEGGARRGNIGFWTNEKDWISWTVRVRRGAVYELHLVYSCDSGDAGSEVSVLGQPFTVVSTGRWGNFKEVDLGAVRIEPGVQVLKVVPYTMPNGAVMNLKKVVLTPS